MTERREAEHWRELHRRSDLSAVGQSGLTHDMNTWLYRTLARNVDVFLRRHDVAVPTTVYDVGSGTGFWVEHWLDRGAQHVDGCDLVTDAVGRLNDRFGPRASFVVANISRAVPGSEYAYWLVSCMNVLLHVLDDGDFERAAGNLARLVAPGGWLLLAEPMARDPRAAARAADGASVARGVAQYRVPIEAEGLRLVAIQGASAFGNNPIEGGAAAPLWRLWWALVRATARLVPGLVPSLGRLIYRLDEVALHLGAAPSGKLALFRRSSGERGPTTREQ